METKPQLRIDIDTTRTGDLGVSSVNDVSQALQTLLGSRRVSTYVDRGEEYRVTSYRPMRKAGRPWPTCPPSIVRARDGGLVPLSNLVSTHEVAGPRDLGPVNKLRAITLEGGLAPGYSLGEALTFLQCRHRRPNLRKWFRWAIAARASPSSRPADRSSWCSR